MNLRDQSLLIPCEMGAAHGCSPSARRAAMVGALPASSRAGKETECRPKRPRKKTASGRWCLRDDRPPTFQGWITTDADAIGRREWRGRTEIAGVLARDDHSAPFCDRRVTSSSGGSYTVEIRSLSGLVNSCECHDAPTAWGPASMSRGSCSTCEATAPHPLVAAPDATRNGAPREQMIQILGT